MAIDRTPDLKRCRALGIEAALIGRSRKSTRNAHRTVRKVSEYALQLKEKQNQKNSEYGVKKIIIPKYTIIHTIQKTLK